MSLVRFKNFILEKTADKKGHFRPTEKGAGMTQKGVDAVNRKTGGNLQTAVTGKVKPGSKAAKRRKSFKARHAKNIAKGKMSAAYWADKEKW